jgi:hypothetical protein
VKQVSSLLLREFREEVAHATCSDTLYRATSELFICTLSPSGNRKDAKDSDGRTVLRIHLKLVGGLRASRLAVGSSPSLASFRVSRLGFQVHGVSTGRSSTMWFLESLLLSSMLTVVALKGLVGTLIKLVSNMSRQATNRNMREGF